MADSEAEGSQVDQVSIPEDPDYQPSVFADSTMVRNGLSNMQRTAGK